MKLMFVVIVKGRGTVATGRVEQGTIKVGEDVEILGLMQVRDHWFDNQLLGILFKGSFCFFFDPLSTYVNM